MTNHANFLFFVILVLLLTGSTQKIVASVSYFQNITVSPEDSSLFIISRIKIKGNIKTKSSVILNELTFSAGDTIVFGDVEKAIKKSTHNLKRTPLFNHVQLIPAYSQSQISFLIIVTERWYLWPEVRISYADQNLSNWLRNKEYLRSNIGLGLMKYNFRGKNEKLNLLFLAGYDNTVFFNYKNIRLDKLGKHRLGLFLRHTKRKETGCCIINDTVSYYKASSGYAMQYFNSFLSYSYRLTPQLSTGVSIGYRFRKSNDSLLHLNTEYFGPGGIKNQFLYIQNYITLDTENSNVFPTSGQQLSIKFYMAGFRIFNPNDFYSFATLRYSYAREFTPFFFSRTHFSYKVHLKENNPFYMQGALGYENEISGYEYYTVQGNQYLFMQQRFSTLLLEKIIPLKFLPLHQFNRIPLSVYFELHTGFGYVWNNSEQYNRMNKLANTPLYSFGIGMNFVTYYDILLRIEYSINHMNEKGVFLHVGSSF
ncbi:MAG: POTRA domain-containing protein [Bacteroidota bacterium]|nr:POTRA domain-containing protein [Bacteroidota bacterium]